jgi:hypothetical protein
MPPAAALTAPERAERKAAFRRLPSNSSQPCAGSRSSMPFFTEQQKIFDSQFHGRRHHFGHH